MNTEAQQPTTTKTPACERTGPLVQFKTDGEDYKTHAETLTANDIIKDFAGLDPETHYLVRIEGHDKESFEGKGDAIIKMRDHLKFQVICKGPMTVSDPAVSAGVMAFCKELIALGYAPISLPTQPNHVTFDYEVPSGKHAGLKIKQGFIIPDDFPLTPPSGPHVSLDLHAVRSGGEHPTGGIHASPFEAALSEKWQYWSRPFQNWVKSKKNVAAYMSHIWRLWDSQ
jgi:hypothetical protein